MPTHAACSMLPCSMQHAACLLPHVADSQATIQQLVHRILGVQPCHHRVVGKRPSPSQPSHTIVTTTSATRHDCDTLTFTIALTSFSLRCHGNMPHTPRAAQLKRIGRSPRAHTELPTRATLFAISCHTIPPRDAGEQSQRSLPTTSLPPKEGVASWCQDLLGGKTFSMAKTL